jgi:hypothetical protein
VVIPPTKAEANHRLPTQWREARAELAHEYFADLFEAWRAKGKAVLDTVAMLQPDVFLRVVASHMPREMHATVLNINLDRMSTAQLEALLAEEITDTTDPDRPEENAKVVHSVGP